MPKPKFEVRSKVWIEVGGWPVLGEGRRALLRAIDEQGSISKAARLRKITYRKAWGQIQAMEKRLGLPLVRKQTGGPGGGGARITPEAREFLDRFERLTSGIQEQVDRQFRRVFYEDR